MYLQELKKLIVSTEKLNNFNILVFENYVYENFSLRSKFDFKIRKCFIFKCYQKHAKQKSPIVLTLADLVYQIPRKKLDANAGI